MNVTNPLLLLIEDDPQFQTLLSTTLESQDYQVLPPKQDKTDSSPARNQQPSLLILDLGLPDIDGQEVICRLRKWSEAPIIVLSCPVIRKTKSPRHWITARTIISPNLLAPPYSMSRIKALLKRVAKVPGGAQEAFQVGELKIELTKRRVFVGEQEVSLTPIEFDLLGVLVRHAGFVVTHRQLLEQVWGASYIEHSHDLRIYMGQLRHKLESDPARPRYLLTEAGVAYRLYEGEN